MLHVAYHLFFQNRAVGYVNIYAVDDFKLNSAHGIDGMGKTNTPSTPSTPSLTLDIEFSIFSRQACSSSRCTFGRDGLTDGVTDTLRACVSVGRGLWLTGPALQSPS